MLPLPVDESKARHYSDIWRVASIFTSPLKLLVMRGVGYTICLCGLAVGGSSGRYDLHAHFSAQALWVSASGGTRCFRQLAVAHFAATNQPRLVLLLLNCPWQDIIPIVAINGT